MSLITAAFGFWPYGSYKNSWVSQDADNNAVVFGEFGYLYGSIPEVLEPQSTDSALELTLNVQLHNQQDSIFRVILNVGGACENNPLIIGQWRTYLTVMQGCDYSNKSRQERLYATLDDYFSYPTTLDIVLNNGAGELRLNDIVVDSKATVDIDLSLINNSALYVGNTPEGRHGWSGTMFDFRIKQVVDPGLVTQQNLVLRQFDLSDTSIPGQISDSSAARGNLHLPEVGYFPTRIVLEIAERSKLIETLQLDVLINLIGFAPIGFALAMFLVNWTGMSAFKITLTSLIAAVLLSLSIELSQVFIAGRQSAMHDLILNTAGGIVGVGFLGMLRPLKNPE